MSDLESFCEKGGWFLQTFSCLTVMSVFVLNHPVVVKYFDVMLHEQTFTFILRCCFRHVILKGGGDH